MKSASEIFKDVLALGVHLLTASGIIAGFFALVAIDARDFRSAMGWLLVAFFIDSIDGTLARAFETKKRWPDIDGKSIDYVVDFVNYAVVPAYFVYKAGMVQSQLEIAAAVLILFVSAMYYGLQMVTDDYYFKGFPVMWNMVIFYLFFVFEPGMTANAVLITILAVMHFLPIKFAYPSRATKWKTLTVAMSGIIFLTTPAIVWMYPDVPQWLRVISVLTLAYFGVLAVVTTFFGQKEEVI